MGMVRYKHVRTGEYRDVEGGSSEEKELVKAQHDAASGQVSSWELIGPFQVTVTPPRDDVPTRSLAGVGPEVHPERALSPAELEAGISSFEQKRYEQGLGPAPAKAEQKESDKKEKAGEKPQSAADKADDQGARSGAAKKDTDAR